VVSGGRSWGGGQFFGVEAKDRKPSVKGHTIRVKGGGQIFGVEAGANCPSMVERGKEDLG